MKVEDALEIREGYIYGHETSQKRYAIKVSATRFAGTTTTTTIMSSKKIKLNTKVAHA